MIALTLMLALPSLGETKLSDFHGVAYETETPWNAKAAELLKTYLGKMTGNIFNTPPDIFIGKKAVDEKLITSEQIAMLGSGGYIVVLKNGKIGITGKDDGALYGVRALLMKYGLEYYAFGCEKLPGQPLANDDFTITASPPNIIRFVDFSFRENVEKKGFPLVMLGFSPEFEKEKLSVMPQPSWKNPAVKGDRLHSVCAYVSKDEFLDTHPEYFAKNPDGSMKERDVRESSYQLCYSNKDVQNLLYTRMREFIKDSPEGELFSLTFGDHWGWCECPDCKKLDPFPIVQKGQYYTMMDRWLACTGWIFQKLHAEFPDKMIVTAAYFCCEQPPTRETPPKGLTIMFCPCGGCNVHGFDCEQNKKMRTNIVEWREKFPQTPIIFFDYPMNYTTRMNLFYSLDGMNARMRFYSSDIGAKGILHCGCPVLFTDLYLYEQGLLAWTPEMPETELKKHEEHFMDAYYGKAAPEMKEFLALVREQTKNNCASIYGRVSPLADRRYAEKAYVIFAKAEQAASGCNAVLTRIKREKLAGLVYTDVMMSLIPRSGAEKLKLLKEFTELSRDTGLLHPGSNPWDEIIGKFNIFIAKGYRPWDKNPAMHEWSKDPALKPLLACSTDKDFEDLARKIGIDSSSLLETENTPDAIKFLPHSEKNKEYADPSGKKRRALLLDGSASESAEFEYEGRQPLKKGKILLEGLDHDKSGTVSIEITINNHVIFSGENTFGKDKWGTQEVSIPDGLITPGRNMLIIRNLARPAPHANWVIISSAEITPSNSKWKRIAWFEDYDNPENLKYISTHRENASVSVTAAPNVKFNGKATLKLSIAKIAKGSDAQFWRTVPEAKLPREGAYKITFYMKAAKAAPVRIMVFSGKNDLYNKKTQITPQWSKISFSIAPSKDRSGGDLQIPRLKPIYLEGDNVYHISPPVVETE